MSNCILSFQRKQCTHCKKELPSTLDYFGADKRNANGLQGRCRYCAGIKSKEYRKNNPDKVRESRKIHHEKYRDRNRAISKAYRLSNLEKSRARSKQWSKDNAQKNRDRAKEWALTHPDILKKRVADWKKNNPDRVRVNHQRRRTKKHSAFCKFTIRDWESCLSYFNYKCAVCERESTSGLSLSQDHWVALSNGGEHSVYNIVPMCNSLVLGMNGCNNSKYNSDPIKWLFSKFEADSANRILDRIQKYFEELYIKNEDNRANC